VRNKIAVCFCPKNNTPLYISIVSIKSIFNVIKLIVFVLLHDLSIYHARNSFVACLLSEMVISMRVADKEAMEVSKEMIT